MIVMEHYSCDCFSPCTQGRVRVGVSSRQIGVRPPPSPPPEYKGTGKLFCGACQHYSSHTATSAGARSRRSDQESCRRRSRRGGGFVLIIQGNPIWPAAKNLHPAAAEFADCRRSGPIEFGEGFDERVDERLLAEYAEIADRPLPSLVARNRRMRRRKTGRHKWQAPACRELGVN